MKYKRTLIIGDIHGNLNALESALEKAGYKVNEDRIICLGDYIDGWKQSYEVVERLIDLQENSPFDNIFLKGNHDYWFLEVLNQSFERFRIDRLIATKHRSWIMNDGLSTYISYKAKTDDEILRHKTLFFDTLKMYHIEDQKLFVHAGFDYKIGFEACLDYDQDSFLWDRSLFRKVVQLWNLEVSGEFVEAAAKKIDQFEKIYIGHTPTTRYGFSTPQVMGNVINVDQGCKKRGVLSIWVEEEGIFFQSTIN